MALFGGGKTSQEVADLRAQLATADATIAELREWVTQLRGVGTPTLEGEPRSLHEAVETERQQEVSVRAQLDQLRAEVTQAQAELVETREQLCSSRSASTSTRTRWTTRWPTRTSWPNCGLRSRRPPRAMP